MMTYIIRRLLISLVLVFVISVISFTILKLTPGGSQLWLQMNPKISQAAKENYVRKYHLDRPLYEQYWLMMRDLFRGELRSSKDERPVIEKIGERLPATLRLNLVALLLEFGFGIPWGVFAARHWNNWKDRFGTFWAFVFIAMPGFWLSYMLCMFLVGYLGMPILGMSSFGVDYGNRLETFLDGLWHVLIPAAILALSGVAVISRFVRASTLETLGEDYIRTARAKGLSEKVTILKHVVRNALIPVVTLVALQIPAIFTGAVITEQIFRVPGIGSLLITAILANDTPVIMAITFVFSCLVVLFNLIADLLYGWLDPRISYR